MSPSSRRPLRVHLGAVCLVALVFVGSAWIHAAFGAWALVVTTPVLGLLAYGLAVQLFSSDPATDAKRHARSQRLADAWCRDADSKKAANRALRAPRIRR
jgi:hypothetical protein